MKVHYRSRAIIDLDEIYQYIAERNPRAARNFADAISDAIAHIAKFPMSASCTSDPGIRVKIVQKYPYKIYFEVGTERRPLPAGRSARRCAPRQAPSP